MTNCASFIVLCAYTEKIYDPCHDKIGCKIFVIVIPRAGMAGNSPAKPSFVMTATIELQSLVFTDYITFLQPVSYQKKAWLG